MKQIDYTLNSGYAIPAIGLGTYKMPDDDSTARAVAFALCNGYSSVDCASFYENQRAVGRGIADSGRRRDEVFVTSKVWRDSMGYDRTMRSFESTLADLQLDYLDLYLLHWPATEEENRESWRALTELAEQGLIRSIGVSNFSIEQLESLIMNGGPTPAVNQVEYHPGLMHADLSAYCRRRGILVEAWSPLARGRIFSDSVLNEIASNHNKTVAQICLRWELQHGVRPIPKSTDSQRLIENINIFDFTLSEQEMLAIDSL